MGPPAGGQSQLPHADQPKPSKPVGQLLLPRPTNPVAPATPVSKITPTKESPRKDWTCSKCDAINPLQNTCCVKCGEHKLRDTVLDRLNMSATKPKFSWNDFTHQAREGCWSLWGSIRDRIPSWGSIRDRIPSCNLFSSKRTDIPVDGKETAEERARRHAIAAVIIGKDRARRGQTGLPDVLQHLQQ